MLGMLKSKTSGNREKDFLEEWKELADALEVTAKPEKISFVPEEDGLSGWTGITTTVTGTGTSTAFARTFNGKDTSITIFALLQDPDCMAAVKQFLASVKLKEPPPPQKPAKNN